jgi:iron(III) transport system substrate-binding protein
MVALLVVPFLLRPRDRLLDPSGEPLVIITPHGEPIRYEFARGFRQYMRDRGRNVRIDWRTPGGTSEITRFLAAEYASSFENFWRHHLGRTWTPTIASAFADKAVQPDGSGPDDGDRHLARRTFLDSQVGIGIDLLFGTGSTETVMQAEAGRLVDSGFLRAHPQHFQDNGIPDVLGGKPLWDTQGRWFGTCLTAFGICYNRDSLARLGEISLPVRWDDLAAPALFGQVALADPTKSGSAGAAFEMIIQQQMNQRASELPNEGITDAAERDAKAQREGWNRAMRLIRNIAANARYFSDTSGKVPLDVAVGDAAAGMCIDYYGRYQSETSAHAVRLGFSTPRGGTAIDTDPIGLLRGAPHRELALLFIEFVLSPDGQKLWNFRVGSPGGPARYAIRRLPILPELYAPKYEAFRSDPHEDPYDVARSFTYHRAWTASLFRTIGFVVKVMCVDTHEELRRAYRALREHRFPPQATAVFENIELVDHAAATGPIRAATSSPDPLDEATLANRLVRSFRAQYEHVVELANADN